jgi:hypothetical protein
VKWHDGIEPIVDLGPQKFANRIGKMGLRFRIGHAFLPKAGWPTLKSFGAKIRRHYNDAVAKICHSAGGIREAAISENLQQ